MTRPQDKTGLYKKNQHLRSTLSPPLQGPDNPVRHIAKESMKFEYDLWGKRLHPWNEMPAPFGGAWCVVKPGTFSLPHQHEEREMFICVEGTAHIVMDGEHTQVSKGDLISIPPETEHYIDNTASKEDFHFFTVWWDMESAQNYMDKMVQKEEC